MDKKRIEELRVVLQHQVLEPCEFWVEADDVADLLALLNEQAEPEKPAPPTEELILRRLLWLRHSPGHFSVLYGDDGEMQCSACGIDFKRDAPRDIEAVFTRQGTDKMAKAISEGWHWDDKGRFLPPDKPAPPEPVKAVDRERVRWFVKEKTLLSPAQESIFTDLIWTAFCEFGIAVKDEPDEPGEIKRKEGKMSDQEAAINIARDAYCGERPEDEHEDR